MCRLKKILNMIGKWFFKYRLITFLFLLFHPAPCYPGSLAGTPVTPDTELFQRQIYESLLTALLNHGDVIPVDDLDKGNFVCITVGNADGFSRRVNSYLGMPVVNLEMVCEHSLALQLKELDKYDRVIAGISSAALPLNDNNRNMVSELTGFLAGKDAVVVFFGPPLFLGQWHGIENVGALLLAYDDNIIVQDLAAQALFGAIGISGKLHQPAGTLFPPGSGLTTRGGLRLKYTIPEEAGLDSRVIGTGIDSIVGTGLAAEAFPGCRVLVAIGGKIIFDRSYGYHTYDRRVKVHDDDIYDLASVTKISGPLPLYMKLADEGLLDIDRPLSFYWDDWRNRLFRRSNKEHLIIRDLLAHQSGIVPYLNYWPQTLRDGRYIRRWYRFEPDDRFSLEISNHLFLRDRFRERVYRTIRRSDLLSHGEYRYSCLPFIISPEVIQSIDGRPYVEALYEDFFKPLGAASLRYNPLNSFPASRIVPTEYDDYFRKQLVHGYVHDEASAVLGGISGNAGLFSSAGDLAKLLQMYLNGGEYGGRRYLSEEVLKEFTRVQFPENNNRRALGFDKPLPDNDKLHPGLAYPSPGASASSFGHSGFTGTFVWMDPEYDLLYIFLSNRVHPARENNLISRLNIRTAILQFIYDEMEFIQPTDE
jgi:CubicO group peptidase (beta-lactamase class C family)